MSSLASKIKGGVSYFLWRADHSGETHVTLVRGDERTSAFRQLDEFDVFVREPRAVEILHKVQSHRAVSITEILSADKEFGWTSNFSGFNEKEKKGDPIFYNRQGVRQPSVTSVASRSPRASILLILGRL